MEKKQTKMNECLFFLLCRYENEVEWIAFFSRRNFVVDFNTNSMHLIVSFDLQWKQINRKTYIQSGVGADNVNSCRSLKIYLLFFLNTTKWNETKKSNSYFQFLSLWMNFFMMINLHSLVSDFYSERKKWFMLQKTHTHSFISRQSGFNGCLFFSVDFFFSSFSTHFWITHDSLNYIDLSWTHPRHVYCILNYSKWYIQLNL